MLLDLWAFGALGFAVVIGSDLQTTRSWKHASAAAFVVAFWPLAIALHAYWSLTSPGYREAIEEARRDD